MSKISHSDPYKPFVGIWRRKLANGHFEQNGPFVAFKPDRTFLAEYPGETPINGRVISLQQNPGTNTGKIVVYNDKINANQTFTYMLGDNHGFRQYYIPNPLVSNDTPPVLNELRLQIPGLDQLYAFIFKFRHQDVEFPPQYVLDICERETT